LFPRGRGDVYVTFFLPPTATNKDPRFLLGGDIICLIHQAAREIAAQKKPLNRHSLLEALSSSASSDQPLFLAGRYPFNEAHDNRRGVIYFYKLTGAGGTPRWERFSDSAQP